MVRLKKLFSKMLFCRTPEDEDVWRKCLFSSFALQKCARKACGQQGYNNDQFGLDLWSRPADRDQNLLFYGEVQEPKVWQGERTSLLLF